MARREPIGSMKRAWKRLRKGGSSGYPGYGGTGAAIAITRKFLCAGMNIFPCSEVKVPEVSSCW